MLITFMHFLLFFFPDQLQAQQYSYPPAVRELLCLPISSKSNTACIQVHSVAAVWPGSSGGSASKHSWIWPAACTELELIWIDFAMCMHSAGHNKLTQHIPKCYGIDTEIMTSLKLRSGLADTITCLASCSAINIHTFPKCLVFKLMMNYKCEGEPCEHDICENTNGSFKCNCTLGYVLNMDGLTCDGKIIIA